MVWTFVAPMSASAQANEAQQAAVTGLSVSTGTNPGELDINWDPHPAGPGGYHVAWAPSHSGFRPSDDADWNSQSATNSLTVTGLAPDRSNQVRVRAKYGDGQRTDWSATANGTSRRSPQQDAVTGVTVTAGTNAGDLDINWDAHPKNATEYHVAWTLDGENFKALDDADWNAHPTTNSYTVTGLTPDASYQASVKAAFNQEPESEWSAIAMGNSAAETEPAPTPEPVDGDSGGTLSDPLIYLRDPSGNSIVNNTDINPTNVGFTTGFRILDGNSGNGNNAQLKIDVNTSGKYIIVAAATGTSNAGTYTLVVTRTE